MAAEKKKTASSKSGAYKPSKERLNSYSKANHNGVRIVGKSSGKN